MSLRLFVALELPDRVRGAVGSWGRALAATGTGVRPVDPTALHVTLCFLGPRPEEEAAAIARALKAGAAPARRLALGKPRRYGSALALQIEDGTGELAKMQASLTAALCKAAPDWKPESRAFNPHVTAARVRGGRPGAARAPLPGAWREPPDAVFGAEEIVLYRSDLSSSGSQYEALARVRLPR